MSIFLKNIKLIVDKYLFIIIPLSFILMTLIEIVYGCAITGSKDASLGGFFVIEGWELIFLFITIIYTGIVKDVRHRKFTILINALIIVALLNMFYYFALHQLFNSESPFWYPVLSKCNGLWFITDKMMLNTYIDPNIDPSLETYVVYSSVKNLNGNLISSIILICLLGVVGIYYFYFRRYKSAKKN